MADPAEYLANRPGEGLGGGVVGRGRPLVAGLRLALLLLFEVGALAALVGLDQERWRVDWAHLWTWLETSPVEDAVVGLLRWVGIVIVGWLLASSVLYALARLTRVPALLRGAQWLTLPVVRNLVERALAVTLAASSVVAARGAAPAWAHPLPPPAVRTAEVAAAAVLAAPAQTGNTASAPGAPPPGSGASDEATEIPLVELVPATEVEVRRGDHLWGIAAGHLAAATGVAEDGLDAATVAPYWLQVVEANRPRLRSGHPGLIFAGEQVLLPPVLGPAPAAVALPGPGVDPLPAPASAAGADPLAAPDPPLAELPDVAPAPAPTREVAPTVEVPPPGDSPAEDGQPRSSRRGPSLAERIGLTTTSAVLAAGVLQVVKRLRRRRERDAGAAPPRRPPRAAAHVDLAMRTTEGLDDVAWAAATLRQLGTELLPHRDRPFPAPRCVDLGPDGLEVLWEDPRPDPPPGWSTVDGGVSWRRARSIDPSPPLGAPAPCPALVTIGRREDTTVLVNLETTGPLTICGTGARDIARSMCLELGTSPFAELTTVVLCGFAVDGVEHLDGVVTTDLAGALSWLRDRGGSAGHELDRLRLPSAFAARTTAGQFDPLEPVVVVAAGDRLEAGELAELAAAADPRRGAAVVVVDPVSPVGDWCLRADSDRAVLEPLGLTVAAAAVSQPVASQLAVLLDDAAGGEDPLAGADGAAPDALVVADASAGLVDPDAAVIDLTEDGNGDYADPPFDVEVRILGQVEVVGAPNPLTGAELELLTYLATHRGGDTADTIMTMLCPEGSSPKTFHNRITLLRRKLGRGRDGELLIPLVTDSRYRVSSLVLTDWDRFLGRIRQAELEPSQEATELLRQALEMVGGPPFRAKAGYSWAHSEGAVTEIQDPVKAAALRLAELYLDAGDPAGALWAARRGQQVADTLADAQKLVAVTMEAHGQLGNAAAALGAFHELMADLAEVDPGLEPEPMVLEAYRAISGSSPRGR